MKIIYLLLFLLGGAIFGALMGCYGKCSSGACPLTANPFRGAIWGALIGLMLGFSFTQNGTVVSAADSQNIVEIRDIKDFDAKIAENKVVVADFYATWCPPCKELSPIFANLSNQYTQKALFLKIDIDKNKELAKKFNIEGIPCVVFFKDGKERSRLMGLRTDKEYKTNIEDIIK